MSTYTKRRHNPQGQHSIAGKRHGNVDGADRPFPNKPVSHRRPLNPRKQGSPDLYDFEKITITKQPKGPPSPQELYSNDTRETSGSQQHPRKDSHRLPSGELQMARAIHAKELMLQEKLWSVEEKIRAKIQRDAGRGDEQRSEERRHDRGRAERGRGMMMQGRGQEDERSRGKRRDVEDAQRKEHKGKHQMTVQEEERSGKLYKPWWEDVEGRDGKDNGVWAEDGTVKTREREQNTTTKGQTRENKYRERSHEDGRQLSGGARLPPASPPSPPSRSEQEVLRPGEDGTDSDRQVLLPCRNCNRKFTSDRLPKHVQICQKLKHRPVFNSYANRTKGSAAEAFWKTHSRPKSPEVLKKKNHKTNTRNLHEGRPPAGTSQPKWSK